MDNLLGTNNSVYINEVDSPQKVNNVKYLLESPQGDDRYNILRYEPTVGSLSFVCSYGDPDIALRALDDLNGTDDRIAVDLRLRKILSEYREMAIDLHCTIIELLTLFRYSRAGSFQHLLQMYSLYRESINSNDPPFVRSRLFPGPSHTNPVAHLYSGLYDLLAIKYSGLPGMREDIYTNVENPLVYDIFKLFNFKG